MSVQHVCGALVAHTVAEPPPLTGYSDIIDGADTVEFMDGAWWLFMGDNQPGRWATNITFCPFCGIKLEPFVVALETGVAAQHADTPRSEP